MPTTEFTTEEHNVPMARRGALPQPLRDRGVTRREAEVLQAVSERLSNAEISDRLCISVRTVESHVSALLSKLGAESRSDLGVLGRTIGSSWMAPVAPGREGARVERTLFVGREAERAELRRLLDHAREGRGALVLLGGEPGVGKTRLAEELAGDATARNMQVFVGHSYETAGAPPYIPFVEILEQALTRAGTPGAFRQALDHDAPEVAKLIPQIRRLCPDIPPPLDVPPEQARRLLFNAVRDTLFRTARQRPVLLVLDDVHWADEPTLLLLTHLAEGLSETPVLVVGTYRDAEADVGWPLANTFEDLLRRHLARHLPVRPMPQAEVAQILRALGGQDPPPALVDVFFHETEGNPFFVEEVFKFLVEEGRLFDSGGRFPANLEIGELKVPPGVRLVLGRRLKRLGDDDRRVLSTAAVMGRGFSFELLEMACQDEGDVLFDGLDRAERAGLIRSTSDASGHDSFIFAHELIRQTLLSEVSGLRRRRLHLRVADAVERLHAGDRGAHAATVAHHLIEAGASADATRLFSYLVLAGKGALDSAAFEEAQRHLERAAALAGGAEPAERADAFFHLGLAERNAGRWDGAMPAWRTAIEIYEELGDTAAVGRACLVAAFSLGWASRWVEADEMAERGLAALGEEVSPDHARLLAMSAFPLAFAGHREQADQRVTRARSMAEQLGESGVLGYVLAMDAWVRYAYLEHHDAAEIGGQAADHLRAAGDLWQLSVNLGIVHVALTCGGRFREVRRVSQEAVPLADRLGNYGALYMQSLRCDALVHFYETGDIQALQDFAQRDIEVCDRAGLVWVSHGWGWLALAEFLRGDWETAIVHAEKADALAVPGALHGMERALHFEYRAYAGQRGEALDILKRGRTDLPSPGQPNGWGAWITLLSVVEGLVVLGEGDQAAQLYPLVIECIERTGVVSSPLMDGRLAHRIAGMAAAAGAHWDVAERHLLTALEQAEKLPHVVERAHTQRFLARMLLERGGAGDQRRVSALLTEASEAYGRLGMPRHRAMVESMAASQSEPDRVLATVLFTDIVGSTRQAAELGDRRWRELLDRHDEIVRRELEWHGGQEVKVVGDEFVAIFDRPARAIRCACAITETVRDLGLEVRAGLHTGEIERRGDDIAGMAVHIGARVAALAGPGEVLVSGAVPPLVAGSGLEFEDCGIRELKGVPGEWRIHRVSIHPPPSG